MMLTWLLLGCLTLHLVVLALGLEVANLEAATDLGEEGDTEEGNGDRDLLVARDCALNNELAALDLGVDTGASIALHLGSAANEREARSTGLAANLAVEAAAAHLSGAAEAISILHFRKICINDTG
jgi:hypothetical protein